MNRPAREARSDGGIHTAKAVILIAVLAVIGWAVLRETGKPSSGIVASSTTKKTTAPKTTTPVQTLPVPTTVPPSTIPATQIKVQVLNGVLTGSLAGQWSTKLKSFGYITEPPDNATAKVVTSVIYVITPGYQAAATALAAKIGLAGSAVDPNAPAPASAPIPTKERNTANLVLVVGPDLQATG